jgi:hypothetical protein
MARGPKKPAAPDVPPQRAQAPPQRLAQPWFERRDYPELLTLVPRLPPTWQDWRFAADRFRKEAAAADYTVVQDRFNLLDLRRFLRTQYRERLSPEELLAWCQRRLDGAPDPAPLDPDDDGTLWWLDHNALPKTPLPPGRKPRPRKMTGRMPELRNAPPVKTKKAPPPRS